MRVSKAILLGIVLFFIIFNAVAQLIALTFGFGQHEVTSFFLYIAIGGIGSIVVSALIAEEWYNKN